MALYTYRSQEDMNKMLNAPKYNPRSQEVYNTLTQNASNANDNFFTKRGKSIENTFGTTLAAPVSLVNDAVTNIDRENIRNDQKAKMNDIYKQFGFGGRDDYEKQLYAAEDAGNEAEVQRLLNLPGLNDALKGQANANANEMNKFAANYKDYAENDYISNKINQDRGKFAGSAINTLSTAVDLTGLGATPIANAIQGGIEGVADELEQNGLENFDAGRAAQNAAIGATTGFVTGKLNQGISKSLAKNGGNLFKGGNVVRRGLNNLGSKTAVGRGVSTLATGAARGAVSGAVGGATGAGLQSALQGADIGTGISNALQGAVQGAGQGAITGATMAGVNSVINKTPLMQKINQANQDWQQSGDTFGERWKNTRAEDTWGNRVLNRGAEDVRLVKDAIKNTGKGIATLVGNGTPDSSENISNPVEPNQPQLNNVGLVEQAETLLSKYNAIDKDIPTGKPEYGEYNSQRFNAINDLRDNFSDNDLAFLFTKTDNPKIKALISDSVSSPEVRSRLADYEAQGPDINNIYKNGATVDNRNYEGMSPSQMLNSKAQDAGFENYDAAVRNFTDSGEAVKGTDIVEWMDAKAIQKTPSNSWDNIAQEAGYNNYNDAVQRFVNANPNAEVTADSVLTWLDKNPAAETTIAPVQSSKQIKGQRKLIEEITNQFNSPDKPTVRATKPQETFKNLYENWGLSDGDDIRLAVSYAEPGSLIPKMISEAAGEAGIIDLSDAQGMVLDLGLKKNSNYKKTVDVLSDIWDSMPNEDVVGGKSGVNALKFQRAVESAASDAMGTSGEYHIGNNIVDQTTAQNLMRIANNIGDKLDEAATAKGAVQTVLNRHAADIQQMRDALPDNAKWQNMIDTEIAGANTIRDLRHSIKDLTRANIFINNGDENFSTVGGRMAAKYNDIPTSKAGIRNKAVNAIYDKIADSKLAKNLRLKSYDKQMRGDTATTIETPAVESPEPVVPLATTTDSNYNPATQIYNAIGRTEGALNRDDARAAQYLSDVAQEGEVVPNTLEGLVAPSTANNASTSVYNSVYGTQATPGFNSLEEERQVYFFRPTGDEWTDMLSRAMRRAKNAEDYDSLGALFEMYQDAVAKNEKANSSSEVKLTDKQRQANAAQRALDDFETEESNFAYDVSDIPVLGQIANLGGNTYASKAEALALQVGYMLSGATVNAEEARKIGRAYVPQPRDNEATRKSKLAQLRGIISDYQQVSA